MAGPADGATDASRAEVGPDAPGRGDGAADSGAPLDATGLDADSATRPDVAVADGSGDTAMTDGPPGDVASVDSAADTGSMPEAGSPDGAAIDAGPPAEAGVCTGMFAHPCRAEADCAVCGTGWTCTILVAGMGVCTRR